jgi:serine/threonine protein kinase
MTTPRKIGRYEILEELGHGAMGTVYRAKDPAMDRVVALKTILSLMLDGGDEDDFRERFYREARAAGSLNHPGIVPVFDVGEHEGLPFLVMEFISGKTLADAARRGERMSLDRVCELGQKIAEALGYAHQHGVVHRDIKPANILLTSREEHGIERPKITDFGVAKLAAGHTTMTGQILGTPAFMPPEQFTGAPIDGRADIFSLGVVLYWLATGEQPFPGESITAVSYKVVHTEPVPPRKLNPSVTPKLEAIILKCLAKSPEERYPTGEALARELGELRSQATGSALKTAVPADVSPGIDPNATFVEKAREVQSVPDAPSVKVTAPPPAAVAAPNKKLKNMLVLGAVAFIAVAAGNWLISRHKDSPVAPAAPTSVAANEIPQPPSAAPTSAAPPAAEPAIPPADPTPAKPPSAKATPSPAPAVPNTSPSAKPAATASPKSEPKLTASEKVPAPKADAPPPEPAAIDFNPKSLDPKANARLKIEADQMPADLDFAVLMNGKLYLRRSAEGNKKEFDDWYVPPGVQEFRVLAGPGASQKSSNTVSTEFKAKKRHTLKIELRTQGGAPGSGVPQGLYADTQIVVTLK